MQVKDVLTVLEEEGDEKLFMRALYNMQAQEVNNFDKLKKVAKQGKWLITLNKDIFNKSHIPLLQHYDFLPSELVFSCQQTLAHMLCFQHRISSQR